MHGFKSYFCLAWFKLNNDLPLAIRQPCPENPSLHPDAQYPVYESQTSSTSRQLQSYSQL